jgi:hypothetical protein
MPKVEAVIINWRRPNNVKPILQAFREQTEPCLITLLDVHAEPQFALDAAVVQLADRCFRWTDNYGGWNRFVPLWAYRHEYTYLHDDDMLPGRRLIEHFLRCAAAVPRFGVLGQAGRMAADGGKAYGCAQIFPDDGFREVDVIVRGYFVRTTNLEYLLKFREHFAPSRRGCDIVLATGLKLLAGLSAYLTPATTDEEERMNKAELPDDYALHREAGHYEERTSILRGAYDLGWRPAAA